MYLPGPSILVSALSFVDPDSVYGRPATTTQTRPEAGRAVPREVPARKVIRNFVPEHAPSKAGTADVPASFDYGVFAWERASREFV